VTENQTLIRFDTSDPSAVLGGSAISGLQANEAILGIDFRPATGELYGLGSFNNLYTIDVSSGSASLVGHGEFTPSLNGSRFGFDFNPTIDRIRIVSEVDQNLVPNPNDGTSTGVTDLFYAAGDMNEGVDPNVTGSGYTNSFAGATSTQLYGIDTGLRERLTRNERLLADARAHNESLGERLSDTERRFAQADRQRIELAERLASATRDLEESQLQIARLTQPRNPQELQQNRRKLVELADTTVTEWLPFALGPDEPAEQQGQVTGDVVWNDRLETGYLRFIGLNPNDPDVEQYQVWVIDERGMEQKVSGGVFDVTDEGEIIVPVEPGIDVGRVALFAVTVENPGGTWVPDLSRRVVVAPRAEPGEDGAGEE